MNIIVKKRQTPSPAPCGVLVAPADDGRQRHRCRRPSGTFVAAEWCWLVLAGAGCADWWLLPLHLPHRIACRCDRRALHRRGTPRDEPLPCRTVAASCLSGLSQIL